MTPTAGASGERPGPRLLVVDDEPTITELISTALRYEGFNVDVAGTGREALAKVADRNPVLIVLDVMLPDLDGFEVVRRLRADGVGVPVVFLTARDATEDKIGGLHLGGDDYVTKPFSLEELTARVRAVLRRAGGTGPDTARMCFADLELDTETYEVRRGDEPISLTATEFRLLHYLLENAKRVVSKSQILDHVWQYDFGGDPNVVETYISYLRKKVDCTGRIPLIHTLRGIGYSLRLPPER
ncbi:MAG: response regulator transcription factor [Acidimicrobiales bacterium]